MANLDNRFAVAPSSVNMQRSTFSMPYRRLDTGNFGKLIPFYVNEVLPGDTFEGVQTSLFSRMSTPLYPVMDDAWIDYMYFFVPNRLVWSHWAEFLGENKLSAWAQTTDYVFPHRNIRSEVGSVFDHMGIPTYSSDEKAVEAGLLARPSFDIQVLPMRCYSLIWNEWFRNENTTDPILVNTGDSVTDAEVAEWQTLRNASKPFDAFTAALPSPQKGEAVDVPLSGFIPVMTRAETAVWDSDYALAFRGSALGSNSSQLRDGWTSVDLYKGDGNQYARMYSKDVSDDTLRPNEQGAVGMAPINLWANLNGLDGGFTVNQMRQAFQMQRLLELQARSGSRYTEIIKASFGVTSPDARLQRPEYLGGSKVKIQMQQVTQTSATNDESPLGKVGAYSKTVSLNTDFTHSFTEHGYIIGVCVARHGLTYQQGLNRMWSRRGRYSIYWPAFAHIGEQPVMTREIYATGQDSDETDIFGYQEAWYEYRTKPNEVCGMFRSTVDGNLDEWHYADYYTERPYLSEGWMEATGVSVDRTLAVPSETHDQLLFDFQVHAKVTRVMPLYSIPGLIDHF